MLGLIKETIDRLRYKIPLRPRQIQIEITNRCNMDCPMCQREDLGIELEHMSWSHFTTVVDKLGQHEYITLTGWGEPFIHPRVFDMIAYCKEREAFGGPLTQFQNTRFKLAECQTKTIVARCFLDQCIAEHLRGELSVEKAAMSKYWLSDTQGEVLDECVQLHGGYGYMQEYAVAEMWADARVQRIYGGTNEIMKELIARSL